jgi:AcrR family transcriptional regulator
MSLVLRLNPEKNERYSQSSAGKFLSMMTDRGEAPQTGPDATASAFVVLGVRARSKKRISDKIVKAGLRLFRKYGYDAVSTHQIAAEAGVTQRTLFRYFPQKAKILYQGEYDYAAQFEKSLEAAVRQYSDPVKVIGQVFLDLAASHDANRSKVTLVYAIVHGSDELRAVDRKYQEKLDTLLAFALDGRDAYAARTKAKATPSLSSRIMAAIVFASILPIYRAWLSGELKGPLLPYTKAGWAKLVPVLKASFRYAEETKAVYADIDAGGGA